MFDRLQAATTDAFEVLLGPNGPKIKVKALQKIVVDTLLGEGYT